MILEVKKVSKSFRREERAFGRRAGKVQALSGVSFSLQGRTTLGIVGESGSGKTTLAKIILDLIPADTGEVRFNPALIRDFRKDVQIIFQNPYNSLNPKMRIRDIITEPLLIHRIVPRRSCRRKAEELLSMVGLDVSALERYPIEFSGGQRQRICIARALACEPRFLVLDEPISSLDLTIQAQLLDLFLRLKQQLDLTYLFISHNLAVIRHIADSVIVMKDGQIVEQGASKEIFSQPKHAYTQLLLQAASG